MLPASGKVFVMRQWAIPAIPELLSKSGTFEITKASAIMALFAVIMLLASFSMIRKGKKKEVTAEGGGSGKKMFIIIAEGLGVGTLTGLVGAGGGFLIIPALVVLAKQVQ